ncbi:MAG: hypothetical protein ACFFEA_11275 [Candidatus Thorarchaeota archaeon]
MESLSKIRLYGGPNPGGIRDVALDEAILHITSENQGPPTIRVWESMSPTLVLPRSPMPKEDPLIQRCGSKGVSVTRGLSGRMPLLYGKGVLSFSLVDKSTASISGGLETEVAELLQPLLNGIQSEISSGDIGFHQGHFIIKNSYLGAYNTSYYFDYLLLQGMILVHKNLHFAGLMISRNDSNFSSLDQLQSHVSIPHFIDAMIQSMSQHLGLPMSTEPASAQETNLMNELYQWKYTDDAWIYHQSEPLALGRVLLEAYLAYPPTTRCREIMAMIDEISKTYKGKVECRTWLRGRGLVSWLKGIPPGLRPSGGVIQASKKNIVPAIVVEGQITHKRTVPVYDNLCSIVEKAYRETFGGTLK